MSVSQSICQKDECFQIKIGSIKEFLTEEPFTIYDFE